MIRGLEPSEEYDGGVTVRILRDKASNQAIRCSSYEEAIDAVRRNDGSAVTTKIEDRDGELVFRSHEMDIDEWEAEWEKQRRRLSFDLEAHECPHDNVACVADDLCVNCEMDRIQQS